MAETVILTVDNGASRTRLAAGGGRIDQIETYPTPHDYEKAIDRIAAAAPVVLKGKRPDIVGFSVAGEVENGRIVSAGQLQEYRWTGRPFAADVAAALGLSPERVVLRNDCDAGAEAERMYRQPKGDAVGAFMVLSTGFGGSIYSASRIVNIAPGHQYLKPGAICGDGQEGHMEAHISGSGMERKFHLPDDRTNGHPFLLNDDPRWEEVRKDFHKSMDLTLDRCENDYGMAVEIVGFAGAIAMRGPDLLGGLQRALNIRMGNAAPRIEAAIYGDESGLYGAAFAADKVLRTA